MLKSNLYAEKVFAEHPIALWSLDDKLDFVSLVSPDSVNESFWTKTSSVETLNIYYAEDEYVPVASSYKIDVSCLDPIEPSSVATAKISMPIGNFSSLDHDKGTVTIGSYLYSLSGYLDYVRLGYSYVDPTTSQTVVVQETLEDVRNNIWAYLSQTFNVPNISANFSIHIEFGYSSPPVGTSTDYTFYLNGLSVGQWSEDFNTESVGIKAVSKPSSIAADISLVVPADAYGLQNSTGYYVGSQNIMYAKNSGVPMVYGASGVTRLYNNPTGPSAIFPGFGMLNKSGQYQEYTAEMWIRAEATTKEPQRFFGPVHSTDGLYFYDAFIMLKIGKSFASHYVGEWNRPMLLDLRVFNDGASLLINGEEVIELSYLTSELSLPSKLNQSGRDQDWLGFYSYDSVLELDCFSIFSYKVPEVIAKRRFVYGQGVEFPKNTNTSYNGRSFFVDYAFANYSNNHNYPDLHRWSSGSSENLITENNMLAVPVYPDPVPVFKNAIGLEQWLSDNLEMNVENPQSINYLSLSPSDSYELNDGYILLPTLDVISKTIGGIYGVFSATENPTSEQVLVWIEDTQTGNYFSITVLGSDIRYKFKFNSDSETTLYSLKSQSLQNPFFVGININTLVSNYGNEVSTFFGNPGRLKVYISGNRHFDKTFTGRIYRVGISSQENISSILELFDINGFAITPSDVFDLYFDESPDDGQIPFDYDGTEYSVPSGDWPFAPALDLGTYESLGSGKTFLNHTASYTVVANIVVDKLVLDVATDSFWEDSVPLSTFAKYVDDSYGNKVHELDFIQFNLSYPKAKVSSGTEFVTSGNSVRSYVSFKEISEGSHSDMSRYIYRSSANTNGVLKPTGRWSDISRTLYEVTDGTIIYPPAGIDFDQVSIGVRVEIITSGVKVNPVKIKNLHLASQSFNQTGPNKVNTRFALPVYPYTKNGVYFDYKSDNPYEIYKFSSPYLYLTDSSGIRVRGDISQSSNRGITMPINTELAESFSLGALQIGIKYLDQQFPSVPTKIADIDGRNEKLSLYMVAQNSSRTRARIFAVNASNQQLVDEVELSDRGILNIEGVAFYLNGHLVKECFININEWSVLSLQFAGGLNLNSYVGALRINGPVLFNNPVLYPLSASQVVFTTIQRLWRDLASIDIDYWQDLVSSLPPFLWSDILYIPTQKTFNLNPTDLYNAFIGINRVSVTDTSALEFKNHKYSVYQNIGWQSNIVSPV